MSDTMPAAATGLPSTTAFDRRSFLATLAAAGVMTAGAEAIADAAEHPDADLLKWVALYNASEARQDEYDRQVDEAFQRYQPPPIPEALFLREEEPRYVISTSHALNAQRDDAPRYYFCEGLKDLTYGAQRYAEIGEAFSHPSIFTEEARARVREIKSAHEAWKAAVAVAEGAAGVTAPRAAGDAESKIMDDLTEKIALMRAATVEGIRAKARFALTFLSGDVDFVEQELLPGLVA